MKRHLPKLLVALLTFFIGVSTAVGVSTLGSPAYQLGRIEAHLDVLQGHHELRIAGLVTGDMTEFKQIAANEYDIKIVTFGCHNSRRQFDRMRGYNEVSLPAIKRTYGSEVMENIWNRTKRK